jgi:hypothetical protein
MTSKVLRPILNNDISACSGESHRPFERRHSHSFWNDDLLIRLKLARLSSDLISFEVKCFHKVIVGLLCCNHQETKANG